MPANIPELVARTAAAARDQLARDGRPLVVDVNELLIQPPGFAGSGRETADRWPAMARFVAGLLGRNGSPNQDLGSPNFDASRASFDPDTMTFLLQAMSERRPVYLSSETHPASHVDSVAQYLGLLTAWSATSGHQPTAQPAELLLALRQGFDYLGRRTIGLPEFVSRVDLPRSADNAAAPKVGLRTWLKLLRVHQYAKNALVLVPLATAHKFALGSGATALIAAIAFSLCASGAYILNDILDVKADRAHPTKRHRPIASGAISPAQASYAMVLLLIAATGIAASISLAFVGVLSGYFTLTTAYSFWLKRIAIVDVVALATLYSVRVIGGAVAIDVVVSEWLLAFSLFIFMSLALVKRHIELDRQPQGKPLAARDYQPSDKPMVAILAAAAGFNAVVIFTLYISSEAVRSLYSHPQLLWAGCPILMYWIGRVMLLAQRGLIDDDPVVFALRDRVSWLALGAIGLILLVAM